MRSSSSTRTGRKQEPPAAPQRTQAWTQRWVWAPLKYVLIFIVGGVLLTPIVNSINDFFRAKPDVVVNITEVHQVPAQQTIPLRGHLVFMFQTMRAFGVLAVVNTGDPALNVKHGNSITAIHCNTDECAEYGIEVANMGQDRAETVDVDVRAVSGMELVPRTKSPKLLMANCTGEESFEKGCHIEIADVSPRDPVEFSVVSKGFGLRGSSCAVRNCKDCCHINLRMMWKREVSQQEAAGFRMDLSDVKGVLPEAPGLLPPPSTPGCEPIMNFRAVGLPPLNLTDKPIVYYIDFSRRQWVKLP